MRQMNEKDKKKLYKMIDEKTKLISHPTTVRQTIDFWINGVPKEIFDKWRADCIQSYGDIYWAKIWSDHLKAQAYDILISSSVEKAEPEKEKEIDENENIPLTQGSGEVKEDGKIQS